MDAITTKVEYSYLRSDIPTQADASKFMDIVNNYAEHGWYVVNSGQFGSNFWVLMGRRK